MTRRYRMTKRAEAVRAREAAVVEAAFDAFFSSYYDQVTLRDIGQAAGVTEETIRRRFGSKEDLLSEVIERLGHERLGSPRGGAAPGDYHTAVREAVDSYEKAGPQILHALSQEDRTPVLKRATDLGREAHYRVTAEAFAPWLPAADHPDHREALAPFVVALDVYTWKMLRLDMGLSRDQTESGVVRLVEGLIEERSR